MNCKTCDYPLWNLKTRQCPECGTAFTPSEYEFVINSTKFCCPHCDQCYYGTDHRGHLVPREFVCVKCGQRIEMNQMVLRPAEGVSEAQTRIDRMPWLEKAHRSWIKRLLLTMSGGMFNPVRIMRAVPTEGSTGLAWSFALQAFVAILLCGLGLPLLAIGLVHLMGSSRQAAEPLIASVVTVTVGTAILLAITGLWSLAAHGLLRISGGANEPLGRTTQAFCFSAGTQAIMALPCLGAYCGSPIAVVWWIVCATLMLAEAQKVHGGRAAFAVITPVVVVAFIAGAITFGAIYLASVSNPTIFNPMATTPTFDTQYMAQSILSYARNNNGQGPPHAAQLVIDNAVGADSFVTSPSFNTASGVPIAGTTLDRFERLPRNRRQITATEAADALPAGVVAHRVGDFVFTYHGIDFSAADPRLWIVVLLPEQLPGGTPTPVRPVVGLADGTCRPLAAALPQELAAQNLVRQACGLPPLPDLSTVTHDAPASSGDE